MVQITVTTDARKFNELLLYIAEKSETDRRFGATKLNKLLFYADFAYYRYRGKSITGHSYQKLEHGPAPRAFVPVVKQMEEDGECKVVERVHYGRPQKRLVALRRPDLSVFSADEIAFVDALIRDLWPLSAKEVSEKSHEFIGWKLANFGETIPYQATLVGHRQPTPREIEHGLKMEEQFRERRRRQEATDTEVR